MLAHPPFSFAEDDVMLLRLPSLKFLYVTGPLCSSLSEVPGHYFPSSSLFVASLVPPPLRLDKILLIIIAEADTNLCLWTEKSERLRERSLTDRALYTSLHELLLLLLVSHLLLLLL